MNFEIIDNVFQVAVFFAAAFADMVYWFYKRDRLYIILALVHSCFMMGTLYFVLHLVIRGRCTAGVLCVGNLMDCQLLVYAYLSDRALQYKKDTDCKDSCDMWSGSSDRFAVERNFWTGISFYRYFCDCGRGDCFCRCIPDSV